MAAVLVGADYTYTYRRETAFGTAVLTSGVQIPTEELTIDHAPVAHSVQRATGLRGTADGDNWQDRVGSTPTASCSFYASKAMFALFPAVLQKSTDYAAVSSVTTFETYNYSGIPSFASNEGYFYTLLANTPVAAQDQYITSAIGTSLTLSIAPDANEGALYASMDFVGKTSVQGATAAPVVTVPSMSTLYKWSDISYVEVMEEDITNDFISMEVTVNNNAKAIPSAPADNFALVRWEVTGSITMINNAATVETLKALCLSNTPGNSNTITIVWNNSNSTALDADGEAYIQINALLNSFTIDNSEETKVTFNFTGMFNQAGTTPPIKIGYYSA